MPLSSISSYLYSPANRNSCECICPANHSCKSPESQTKSLDKRRDRSPSCNRRTGPAAALCRPPSQPTDRPRRQSQQTCTTPRSQTPQTPTPRHAQTTAGSSAHVSRGTLPSSPDLHRPCPCESPPSSSAQTPASHSAAPASLQ